jgi:hypothetical protein
VAGLKRFFKLYISCSFILKLLFRPGCTTFLSLPFNRRPDIIFFKVPNICCQLLNKPFSVELMHNPQTPPPPNTHTQIEREREKKGGGREREREKGGGKKEKERGGKAGGQVDRPAGRPM